MNKAVYPGSFDPVTLGHLDIIKRASKVSDELIVAVLTNGSKSPLFSVEERVELLQEVTKHINNVRIMSFDGLLVDFAKQVGANAIIRGLRAITDFDYELQMAQTNSQLNSDIDTLFIPASVEYSFLSSSTVKEIASLKGDISKFVHPYVESKVIEKYRLLENR